MKKLIVEMPKSIKNNKEGFGFFVDLFHTMENNVDKEIILDFNKTRWLEANLSAILGAIISMGSKNNNIEIIRISSSVNRILQRNKFLSKFGKEESYIDYYETTIRYSEFKESDKIKFQEYLKSEFIPGIQINMSDEFKKELRLNLEEIFQNARIHGKCDNIHVCGQYFFKNQKVMFTIVDLGKTIVQNYKDYFDDKQIKADKAIDWVTKDGNSTKNDDETGGIGLYQLRQFLKENGGTMQIISSNGYWEENGDYKTMHIYDRAFGGTIVNIEVKVNEILYKTDREKITLKDDYIDLNNIF
ncbi:hypothetical protein [Clostridium baratii]|uniref:hypothetical protein n=1 Tax=Clostridium baratii TaxID=1561 RepID=UPI0022E2DA40|nr:hypothetical protein [Clostridium baratii]